VNYFRTAQARPSVTRPVPNGYRKMRGRSGETWRLCKDPRESQKSGQLVTPKSTTGAVECKRGDLM
jgi:hypothetical protein